MDAGTLLDSLEPKRALLIGDFMLDRYTVGSVDRISPEAPVCIIHVEREDTQPGGAGNAVLNLVSLGMQIVACGRVGDDSLGRTLLSMLRDRGVDTDAIVEMSGYVTPVKNRFIADQQQLMRVDYEDIVPLSDRLEADIAARFNSLFQGIDVIALSDYGKGFLTPSFLGRLIKEANRREVPIIVDPKGVDYSKYRGATLIKPNLSEALAASGLEKGAPLDEIAKRLLGTTEAKSLLITRSSKGITLFTDQKRIDFPAQIREVKDVTGAGDTVLAVMTLSLANQFTLPTAIGLANTAAGLAVERVGCQQITLSELKKRLHSCKELYSRFT